MMRMTTRTVVNCICQNPILQCSLLNEVHSYKPKTATEFAQKLTDNGITFSLFEKRAKKQSR